jgi:tryptophanyl-tRNA synthetase
MHSSETRILTGHRPTGPRHIGHLVGTLEKWAQLQNSHECFFLVADLHVLTTGQTDRGKLQSNIINLMADWLAVGIDPSRSTIVLQSIIPEHAQLSLLFSMLTSVACLERVPTYKEQIKELKLHPSLGLLTYPVLQAADILLYKARVVPVGEDQLPHIELAREIARRFNQIYGETFPEPEAALSGSARLPGIDNRTMHTSYGNAIFLRDSPKETKKKIMAMYTDPTRVHAHNPGHVHDNPVFTYHDVFNPDKAEVNDFKVRYRKGKVGDVEVKRRLAEVMNNYLEPFRQRRRDLLTQPKLLLEVLYSGTVKAKFIAQESLEEAHEKMGLLHSQSFSEKVFANNIAGIFC